MLNMNVQVLATHYCTEEEFLNEFYRKAEYSRIPLDADYIKGVGPVRDKIRIMLRYDASNDIMFAEDYYIIEEMSQRKATRTIKRIENYNKLLPDNFKTFLNYSIFVTGINSFLMNFYDLNIRYYWIDNQYDPMFGVSNASPLEIFISLLPFILLTLRAFYKNK